MTNPVTQGLHAVDERYPATQKQKNKRGIEEQIGKVAHNEFKKNRREPENTEERVIKEQKNRRTGMLKHLEPVIEMQREDAFPLGVQAYNKYQMELIEKLKEEGYDESELIMANSQTKQPKEKQLKEYQYKEIEKLAKDKHEKIGTQFFELFYLLETKHLTRKNQGKAIIAFAKEIISIIPDNDAMEVDQSDSEEIQEEFQKMAEAYISKLPIAFPADKAKNLARDLQNAVNNPGAETSESEEPSERDEAIDVAMRSLGYLLLASQHKLLEVSDCIETGVFKTALQAIVDIGDEILKESSEKIMKHSEAHAKVAIQDSDEALFNKMSVELAEILLLDSGSINFGIIEAAAAALIPEHLKETTAVNNLWLVFDDLATNPSLWQGISNAKPPQSPAIPSNAAIRALFDLKKDVEITKRHAQLFVLSALLGHLRQAKAGTCFATAILIKALNYFPLIFMNDLVEMTEKGYVSRDLFGEIRSFPFIERVSKEYLDVEIDVDLNGLIKSTKSYDSTPDDTHQHLPPHRGACLYEAPGIIAACNALGIDDVKSAVLAGLKELPSKFPVNDFLKQLAAYAYQEQNSALYQLRFKENLTETQFYHKAQYAFGIQTNHPLHRAYEQVATSLVNYFGAQYTMPAWVFGTFEEVIKGSDKGFPEAFQAKYRKLKKELFLPMISRMRYRYNHHFENSKKLFHDGNYGTYESHFYGYQLCDSGLPKDFSYSTNLHRQYKSEGSYLHLERFKEYSPPEQWKSVETQEKFVEFIKDVIHETTSHLQRSTDSLEEIRQWDEVANKMLGDVSQPDFTKKMVYKLFGRGSAQKKDYNKNEYTIMSTPWQFAWGGDFNEVYKTFFGFSEGPSQLKPFLGTPKETLAKCINYIKNQPREIRDDFDNPRSQIVVSSPVHVFLLRPFEETLQNAWQSKIPTNEYIKEHVEKPGLEISNTRATPRQRKELLSFVAKNMWVSRYREKEDWERQQLTETSKKLLDEEVAKTDGLFDLTVEQFQRKIESLVIECRRLDENIGKKNEHWENRFKKVFGNLVKKLVPYEKQMKRRIRMDIADKLLDFARNREDSIALSGGAPQRFLELMSYYSPDLSLKKLREAIVKSAYQARIEYLCGTDPEWKPQFCEKLDTKLFSLLSETQKKKLISSGIVTHDTNWKIKIHNVHFIFLVNPGTGQIELSRYVPDTQEIMFEDQSGWFPRKEGGHGYWQFPDNYRQWSKSPLFNVKKFIN